MSDAYDLHHHGDAEVGGDLVDLAVNVQLREPPPWLAEVITASSSSSGPPGHAP